MGQEKTCSGALNGQEFHSKVLLESDHLRLKGEPRATIRYSDLTGIQSTDDSLTLQGPHGNLRLDIGKDSTLWAEKIRHPKSLAEKLGLKQGTKVALIGEFDQQVCEMLTEAGSLIIDAEDRAADFIYFLAESVSQLGSIPNIKNQLNEKTALWIISPKGKKSPIKDTEVIAAARAAGLVDTKVTSFSPTHTALKFVLRK